MVPDHRHDIITLASKLQQITLLKTPTQENEAILPLFKLIGVEFFTVNDFFDLVIETCLPNPSNQRNKDFDGSIEIIFKHHHPKKLVPKISESNCIWAGPSHHPHPSLHNQPRVGT